MALSEYNRSLDQGRLVRDANLEVLEVFYPPHFEDIEDAGVGNSSPLKKGAICTVIHEGKTNIAVYQGDGEWLIVGDSTLKLGETADTAHRGDHGKAAYEHSLEEGNPHNTQIGDIDGLEDALAEAGKVKSVNDVLPDENGNVEVGISDIDGLSTELTAKANDADVVKKSGDTMTGKLQLPAGTTSNPPLVIPSGQLTTVLQNGAIESDGSNLYATLGGTRYPIIQQYLAQSDYEFISHYTSTTGVAGTISTKETVLVTDLSMANANTLELDLSYMVGRISSTYVDTRKLELQCSVNGTAWETISTVTFDDSISGNNAHALPISGVVRITKDYAGLSSYYWQGCHYSSWDSHRISSERGTRQLIDIKGVGIGLEQWNLGVKISLKVVSSFRYKVDTTQSMQTFYTDIAYKIKRVS